MRIDRYLAASGLVKSRETAQKLIAGGQILLDGRTVAKPSLEIDETNPGEICLTGELLRYVSRGGLKLERALEVFGADVSGADAVDIGASTGGFTDCLLKHGAAKVRAVDVGRSQLDPSLESDPRVTSFEGMNARYLTPEDIGGTCGVCVCDVSFISLTLILPAVRRILNAEGRFFALIKPQFEAGRAGVGKNGIVKDRERHVEAIERVIAEARLDGLFCRGLAPSPITGGDGNREYLADFSVRDGFEPVTNGGIRSVVFTDAVIRQSPKKQKEE